MDLLGRLYTLLFRRDQLGSGLEKARPVSWADELPELPLELIAAHLTADGSSVGPMLQVCR